jgi:hypothetical protein
MVFPEVLNTDKKQLTEAVNRNEGSIPFTRSTFLSPFKARNYSGTQRVTGLLISHRGALPGEGKMEENGQKWGFDANLCKPRVNLFSQTYDS